MTELATSKKLLAQDAPKQGRRRKTVTLARRLLVLVPVVVALLAFQFRPLLLWPYELDRAGRIMAAGLSWPEPRWVDSLPTSRDNRLLDNALVHLDAAMRWRPEHPYAYRLAGQVYAARQEWVKAAEAFERARSAAPRHPLLAWESALVYEQMWRIVQRAPRETILPDLASVPVDAPAEPIESTFCREGEPQSCYVGLTTFVQPYAELPDGPEVAADVLVMHPPARVKLLHPIHPDQPILHFLIGLDPGAREGGTDGATFQVWVEPGADRAELVYERTVDRTTATRGWVPGWADLSPWAGQTVTLVLHTTGGPAEDVAGDWYGWGEVKLMTRDAVQYAMLAPKARMRKAWRMAGLDSARSIARGEEARSQGRADAAVTWYERAAAAEPVSGDQ